MRTQPVVAALSILLLGSVLAGCVSAPVKKTENSSLVLIPTFVDNTSGAAFARKYFIVLSDGYGEFQLSDYNATYVAVVVEKPGVKITAIRSEVDKSRNFQGQPSNNPLDIELPYEPGKIVVADKSFVLVMKRIDNTHMTGGAGPDDTPQEVKDALIAKFKANKANSAWFQD